MKQLWTYDLGAGLSEGYVYLVKSSNDFKKVDGSAGVGKTGRI